MVARVVVKIITLLGTDSLNKSMKDYVIKIMREHPNIDKKDHIMTHIYALESDAAAEKRERISQVEEVIKCKVCEKKHKKRGCAYKCNHCGMMGSHKAKNCWKAFPQLKTAG